MKQRNYFLLLLCVAVFFATTGCNTLNTGSGLNSRTSDNTESNSTPDISSSIVEHVSTICSDPAVNEFLNNTDGHDYKIAVEKFTKAYFSGDMNTVKSYLIHPNNKLNQFNTKDMLADVELLNLKLGSDDIKDNMVHAQYEFRKEGDDSYTYLDLVMKKINNEWKVESYGFEK